MLLPILAWLLLLLSFLTSLVSASSPRQGQSFASASTSAAAAQEADASAADILEENEKISLIMDCTILSQSDREMKAFLMNSLNLMSKNTLDDLKAPMCRAAFDISCSNLSSSQMAQLLAHPDGLGILRTGQCLETFADFSEFTLATFAQFPDLKISAIRHWSTIKPEVLLSLINAVDFASLGRIDIFPERVGMEALSSPSWIEHPTIWQLFLIEGVKHLPMEHKQAFAKFLADETRIERLLAGQSSASTEKNWLTVPSPLRCSRLSEKAAVLARWAIQSEEFMVSSLDDFSDRNPANLNLFFEPILRTRSKLLLQVNACATSPGAHQERMVMLKRFLSYPLTWRFREALTAAFKSQTLDATNSSKMTRHLRNQLTSESPFLIFYAESLRSPASFTYAELFAYFLSLNSVRDLDEIYAEGAVFAAGEDERILLSISIRRLLLMLLTPNHSSSDSLIQEALGYVLKAPDSAGSSSLLHTTENEALYWFQQARDMMSIPVLDRLIVSFGHEFNVRNQIEDLLKEAPLRARLFMESQSSLVRLMAALKPASGPSTKVSTPFTFVDPSEAFITPVKPNEADEKAKEANEKIKVALGEAINLLSTFSASPGALKPFLHPGFSISFRESPGVDVGGLRRAWISALFCFFSDTARQIFVRVDELPGAGLLPTAFIDPQVMTWLGWLHGKALQIGTTPGWFFLPQFAELIFEEQEGRSDEIPSPSSFGSVFDGEEGEDEENTLQVIEQAQTTEQTLMQSNAMQSTEMQPAQTTSPTTDNSILYEKLIDLIPSLYPEIFFIFIKLLEELPEEVAVEYFNDSAYPPIPFLHGQRHSFMSGFLFNPKFWTQYLPNRPRLTVESRQEIVEYHAQLLSFIAKNLESAIQAYRQGLTAFFDASFLKGISQSQWISWLTPVQATIEQIFERISFREEFESMMLIDDGAEKETGFDGEDNEMDTVDAMDTVSPLHTASNTKLSPTAPIDTNSSANPSQRTLKLINAKSAFKRILLSSFQSPQSVQSFLFFATGSPQLPAAGLEALRIQVLAKRATMSAFSKSHTCSSLVEFMVGERFEETRRKFIESIEGSSGFGIV